ncbi:hypothetical protein [Rhodanobacter sp. MP7CTX1]|uniref:hypothetical protein n=1 Tax=Rhodanobacter sp. MP7CTX1 TaxID=2723084 RepID=UPI00160CA772|nr:hypothetical protein [Rhodanobacter sp. MP7CTX1]MBB6185762.1 hypothetical protein [Rhodanobacter sp. MP7CTX1]
MQYDLRRGVGTALIPNTSQVSGYVGTTPVSASVTSYDSYTYDTYCTLMIQMDASGIIVWTKLDGQPSECRKGLQPLLG